jgi:hypothetical protein
MSSTERKSTSSEAVTLPKVDLHIKATTFLDQPGQRLNKAAPRSGVGLNELLGAVVLPIAPLYLRDRTNDKLFERRPIKIRELLEVQANLAHLVLAKLGQQGSLLLSFSHQVDTSSRPRMAKLAKGASPVRPLS